LNNSHQPAPPAVLQAARLLWTSFVLSSISLMPIIRPPPEEAAPELYWGVAVFFMALFVVLVLFTGWRRGWARWTLVAYLALGWINALFSAGDVFGPAPVAAILDFVTMAIELRAAYLLFTKASNDWFRTRWASA
jgi:hypothetical protein